MARLFFSFQRGLVRFFFALMGSGCDGPWWADPRVYLEQRKMIMAIIDGNFEVRTSLARVRLSPEGRRFSFLRLFSGFSYTFLILFFALKSREKEKKRKRKGKEKRRKAGEKPEKRKAPHLCFFCGFALLFTSTDETTRLRSVPDKVVDHPEELEGGRSRKRPERRRIGTGTGPMGELGHYCQACGINHRFRGWVPPSHGEEEN